MAHYCCSCGNLDPKKNKPGKVNGNLEDIKQRLIDETKRSIFK